MCRYQELLFLECDHLVLEMVQCPEKCNKYAPVDRTRRIPLNADCNHIMCKAAQDRRRREGTVKTLDMTYVAGWEEKREEGQSWHVVRQYEQWKPKIADWATKLAGASGSGGGGGGGGSGSAADGDGENTVIDAGGVLIVYDPNAGNDPGHAFGQQDQGQTWGQASWQASAPTPVLRYYPDLGQPSGSGAAQEEESPKKDRKGKGKEKEKDRRKDKGKGKDEETHRVKDKGKGRKKDEGKGKKKSGQ